MTATLTFGPPEASPGGPRFSALAARETRRFVLNPVFLFAVVITAVGRVGRRGCRGHRDRRT